MRRLRTALPRASTWLALGLVLTPFGVPPVPGLQTVQAAYSDLAFVVAIVLAGGDLLSGRAGPLARSVPAAAFWALGAVSTIIALAGRTFPDSIEGGVRFVQLFCLVPLAVLVALRTRADAAVLLGGLLGLAAVQGCIGIFQTLTGTGALIGGEPIRAVGSYGAYNIGALAAVTALALVVSLALAVVLSGRMRWLAAGAAGFFALPLALSLARGAWVAAAVAVVVVLSRGRPGRLVVVAALGAAAAVAALPVVLAGDGELAGRLRSLLDAGSDPDQSLVDRFALWDAALRMAFDHPLTGVGPRGFVEHRDAYADLSLLGSSDIGIGTDFQRVALESPHNFYLLVASEYGLVTAAVFGSVFLLLLTRGLVRCARPRSDASTAVALAGTGLLAYLLVDMITGDLGGPGSAFVAVAIGLAGWAAADQDLLPTAPDASGDRPALPVPHAVDALGSRQ